MTSKIVFWLFSTIAQVLAAIIALVGVIAIFRIEHLSNEKRMVISNAKVRWNIIHNDPDEVRKEICNIIKKTKENGVKYKSGAQATLNYLDKLEGSLADTKKQLKTLLPVLIIAVGVSIVFLILLPSINCVALNWVMISIGVTGFSVCLWRTWITVECLLSGDNDEQKQKK